MDFLLSESIAQIRSEMRPFDFVERKGPLALYKIDDFRKVFPGPQSEGEVQFLGMWWSATG